MNLIVNTDGASRGNPGPASYGYIIKSTDGVIRHQEGKTIGVTTNNVAEYTAVLESLKYIKHNFTHKAPHVIEVITDSQLIASQLSGRFKIKSLHLKEYLTQIKQLEQGLGEISYRNVPRAQNFIADKLANMALDKKLSE
jgi:ribonuclease HI